MAHHQFKMTRRVEFADTDMAGIMHFSNFFRFMEVVEHAFYRSLGFSAHPSVNGTGPRIGWPRVNVSCDFHAPLEFEEEVEIELLVEEIRGKSVRYLFRFWKPGEERRLAATGRMTAVCVELESESGGMKAVRIPDEVRALIEEAPRELLDEA
jgi:YbgC/YbaW family acyl-CoA thioester hydrolase